jgi:excisionase family DNA binding protein
VKIPILLILALAASIDPGANRANRRTTKLEDRFVSVAEAAEYLGVDPRTIRNMLRDGRLKASTLGPRVLRIRLSDLHAALQPYGGEQR